MRVRMECQPWWAVGISAELWKACRGFPSVKTGGKERQAQRSFVRGSCVNTWFAAAAGGTKVEFSLSH